MCQKEYWGAIVATKGAHSTQRGQPPRMHGPGHIDLTLPCTIFMAFRSGLILFNMWAWNLCFNHADNVFINYSV